jgi:two-component system chemotaxis response regulator CheB
LREADRNREQIGVLVVDDSAFMRIALTRIIDSDARLHVLGTASNGAEALEKICTLRPDVVTLDVVMPGLDGLDTLRCIMTQHPLPVIMVSSGTTQDAEVTFRALAAGAFDYVPKQMSEESLEILHLRDDLTAKIRAAAESRRKSPSPCKPPQRAVLSRPETLTVPAAVVAIGVSTGGPRALQQILPRLPGDLSVPVLIVQHMPPGFTSPFAKRLHTLCSVPVHEAVHGEPIRPGIIYLAPAGIHMTVEGPADSQVRICLTTQPETFQHKPSIDVMLESVAAVYRRFAMGVILTGMGCDGALGMSAIHREGGLTLGQDEATSAVYGMPKACAELGILNHVVPLHLIPQFILQASRRRKRA